MTTPEQLDYIRGELAKGVDRNSITAALMSQGWMAADINEAFAALGPVTRPQPVAPTLTPQAFSPSPLQTPQTRPQPQSQGHSKSPIVLVIILVILLLGAGGAYAYVTFIAPKLQSPTEVLKKSIPATLQGMKSFSYDLIATGTVMLNQNIGMTKIPPSIAFNISTNGSADYQIQDNPAAKFSLSVGAESDDKDESGSFNFSFDSIVKDRTAYFNLRNFNLIFTPKTGTPQQKAQFSGILIGINGMVTQFENTWISATSTPKTAIATTTLSKEDAQAIRDYFNGMTYLHSISSLGDETVDGKAMHHYAVTLEDNGDLVALIRRIGNDQLAGNTSELNSFNQQIDSLGQISGIPLDFEIWIGRDDSRIYRIKSDDISISDPKGRANIDFGFDLKLSDFNQPMSIEAPANAITIQALLNKIFGNLNLNMVAIPAK